VVVTNASQVKVTGRKADQILYRKHTLYPGGLKEIKYKDMMSKKPDEVRRSLVSLKFHLLTGKLPDCPKSGLGHVAKK
jgi:ribosomal protein L13